MRRCMAHNQRGNEKLSKTRGAEQLKLSRGIDQSPEKFITRLDVAAAKANLPWTMHCTQKATSSLGIKFGRLEGHGRTFTMLAHLHGLARSGQPGLLSARTRQFLKATELAAQCGGAWKLAWLLTGLVNQQAC
eukprot:4744207-Amphidinium_carterae.1